MAAKKKAATRVVSDKALAAAIHRRRMTTLPEQASSLDALEKQQLAEIWRDSIQAADATIRQKSDDGFIAASQLVAERFGSLTDLKRWLDKLPVGKVRWRKPSRQRLQIHAADWFRYWSEDDRLKSEALDDESMQETLANIAAREREERTRRKPR